MARSEPERPHPARSWPVRVRAGLLVSGLAAVLCAGALLDGIAPASAGQGGYPALAGPLTETDPNPPPGGGGGGPPATESPEPDPTTDAPTDPGTPATTEPAPPTASPTQSPPGPTTPAAPPPRTTTAPAPPPDTPGPPGPQQPGEPRRGVYVTTSDISLPESYWSARDTTADLRVTIANTGGGTELVRLSYTLPPGVTDAGTDGCQARPGGGQCSAWTVPAGARFSTRVRLRIDGDAWRDMPLSGSVQVTASRPRSPSISDNQGFAVLFPAGPPVPGVSLAASEVSFDITGQATTLDVRLGNTGRTDGAGSIEVLLPAGVSVPAVPPGCVAVSPERTRCDLGTIGAGQAGTARLPVSATPEAQRAAPFAGAVIGTLAPRAGRAKTMQMSFRIVAVAALATPGLPAGVSATGSQGALPPVASAGRESGLTKVQKTAIALIGASLLLVVLALALATGSLRRRMGEEPPVADAP